MRNHVFTLALGVLAACTVPEQEPEVAEPAAGMVLLARSGLIVDDERDTLLAFGSDTSQIEARLTPLLGPVRSRRTGRACNDGLADLTEFDDLILISEDGELAGWQARDAVLRTDAGIALGSAESAVSAAYSTTFEQTDQGRRFDAEGFHGLIESGMVRELWAGRPCLAP